MNGHDISLEVRYQLDIFATQSPGRGDHFHYRPPHPQRCQNYTNTEHINSITLILRVVLCFDIVSVRATIHLSSLWSNPAFVGGNASSGFSAPAARKSELPTVCWPLLISASIRRFARSIDRRGVSPVWTSIHTPRRNPFTPLESISI